MPKDKLKPKKVKGRIQVLKALPYNSHMIYIRRIMSKFDKDIFEWLVVFKDQVYSSYMIIAPKKGQTKLTKDEISQCVELLWAGATTTIDTLMGVTLDDKKAEIVRQFEQSTNVMQVIKE